MQKNKLGFTLIELIIVMVIGAILAGLSFMSIKFIDDNNIDNKLGDIHTFVDDMKTTVLTEKSREVYVFLNKADYKNNYIFSYNKTSDCTYFNENNIYDLFKLDSLYYASFSGTNTLTGIYISGTINGFYLTEYTKKTPISFSGTIKEHYINSPKVLYNLYEDNKKCADIYVYFFGEYTKDKYKIGDMKYENMGSSYYMSGFKLEFSKSNLKGELYDILGNSRIYHLSYSVFLKDYINGLIEEVSF